MQRVLCLFFLTVFMTISITSCSSPIPASDSERKLTIGDLERSYLLHVPPGLNKSQPVPVVFAFHEHFDNASAMQQMTGFNAISDKGGFLVVYPEGIGSSWNVGRCCGAAVTKNADETAFVQKILKDLRKVAKIDTKRIYVTGFSNGGALAYRFACEMSDTFAAIASVGGTLLSESCQPSQPVSVMDVHGLNDDVALYEGGGDLDIPPVEELFHTWAQLNDCAGTPQIEKDEIITHTSYLSCKAGTVVELYTIAGGQHVWPTNEVLDTSQIIWDFFAAHPKR